MSIMRLSILIIILWFAAVWRCVAQYQFTHYDYSHGMPLDEVNVIREDSMGYIWMGGPDGLAKFDGRKFTHYYKGKPGYDIFGNIVNDIDVSASGEVLISFDDNGVSVYNASSDDFRSHTFQMEDGNTFPRYSIYSSYIADDSTAYLCANREGLYKLDMNTLESEKIEVGRITRDITAHPTEKGKFLFLSNGLFEWDANTSEVKRLTDVGHNGFATIGDDVWYQSYFEYVYKYGVTDQSEHSYQSDIKGVARGWTIVDNQIWIGLAKGISIIDIPSGEQLKLLNAEDKSSNFKGEFIYEIFKDSRGRVWVSSDAGVSFYDAELPTFHSVPFLPNQSTHLDRLSDDEYLSLDFYNNSVSLAAVSTQSKLVKVNGELKGPVHTLRVAGDLLVVFFNGIGKYDAEKHVIDEFDSPYTTGEERGLVEVMYTQNQLFGIYRYSNTVIGYDLSLGITDTIDVPGEPKTIVDTEDGNIWISGVGFLTNYDTTIKEATHISLESEYFDEIGNEVVKIERGKSDYWLSTRVNGVWKVSFDDGQFSLIKHYDKTDGLENNNIVYSYIDAERTFYVQTRGGIFAHDEASDRFQLVGRSRDLFPQNLYSISIFDNKLYALGYRNFLFDLDQLDNEREIPLVHFADIYVNGKRVDSRNDNLLLDYSENNITYECGVRYFDRSRTLESRYRLDTLLDWIYTEDYNSSIHLTSLATGDYQFQYSVSTGDGLWVSPLQHDFTIQPPYWKTWWFIAFLSVIIGTIIYGLYAIRLRQLNRIHEMNLQLAELEGESLRAQMNPHFVFNALNSIKSYIIKSEKEKAADYLTTFSELIRAVLRNSTEKEITLQSELEALTLYLQIENLRLDDKFDYHIYIDEGINTHRVAFPPLIIQPFVENSIWHGFVNKKSRGHLNIHIHNENENLVITVQDDGIGRSASKKIELARGRKRSYGIAITQTRLHNIMDHTDILIKDLYTDEKACGTEVTIRLPYKTWDNG